MRTLPTVSGSVAGPLEQGQPHRYITNAVFGFDRLGAHQAGKQMHGMKRRLPTAAFLVAIFPAPGPMMAQEMVVGVNVVNPMRASLADQNALLGQLKAADVRVIRCGVSHS